MEFRKRYLLDPFLFLLHTLFLCREEIIYASEVGTEVVGSTEEVLDAGFVIDEDGPEDIMDVFGGAADADDTDAQ